MTEFKVQLDDQFVKTVGYKTIERYLSEYLHQIILKISAREALEDLENIHLENDEKWKIARSSAWNEQSHKYLRTLSE